MYLGIVAGLVFWAIAIKFVSDGQIMHRGEKPGPRRADNPEAFWAWIILMVAAGAAGITFGIVAYL